MRRRRYRIKAMSKQQMQRETVLAYKEAKSALRRMEDIQRSEDIGGVGRFFDKRVKEAIYQLENAIDRLSSAVFVLKN